MSAVNMNEAKIRMEFLAGVIRNLASEEIFALLDHLFPDMDESAKEDLHDTIVAMQFSSDDLSEGRPAETVFEELERRGGGAD